MYKVVVCGFSLHVVAIPTYFIEYTVTIELYLYVSTRYILYIRSQLNQCTDRQVSHLCDKDPTN